MRRSVMRHLEIEGNRYIGIGDGDWLGTFQKSLAEGWRKGWATKDSRGRYWLVLTKMRLEIK